MTCDLWPLTSRATCHLTTWALTETSTRLYHRPGVWRSHYVNRWSATSCMGLDLPGASQSKTTKMHSMKRALLICWSTLSIFEINNQLKFSSALSEVVNVYIPVLDLSCDLKVSQSKSPTVDVYCRVPWTVNISTLCQYWYDHIYFMNWQILQPVDVDGLGDWWILSIVCFNLAKCFDFYIRWLRDMEVYALHIALLFIYSLHLLDLVFALSCAPGLQCLPCISWVYLVCSFSSNPT